MPKHLLVDPGKARGYSSNIVVIYLLCHLFYDGLFSQKKRRRHCYTFKYFSISKMHHTAMNWFRSYGNFSEWFNLPIDIIALEGVCNQEGLPV